MDDTSLAPLAGRPFWVMDGAGNDFVVVDLRGGGTMTAEAAAYLGDHAGPFGCDQIIGLVQEGEGAAMAIWNADGSEAGACGNASRCVASLLFEETGVQALTFGSPSGPLRAEGLVDGRVEVDMGPPRLAWNDIPIAVGTEDTTKLPLDPRLLARFGVGAPAGVSMGNPHAVFFVPDAGAVNLEALGPEVETHALFPDRVNCSVASIQGDAIRLRTWERGVGVTQACGTAACATLVSAHRRGLTGRQAEVEADGGTLRITWDEKTDRVLKAGPVKLHRQGVF